MNSYHVRLEPEDKKILEKRGATQRRWSAQLRYDLGVLWALEALCAEGMADRPVGRILEMARNLARGKKDG